MFIEIYRGVFGTLLLICLCYSAQLSGSVKNITVGEEWSRNTDVNGTRTSTNILADFVDDDGVTNSNHTKRQGKCLGTLKRWLGFVDGMLAGDPNNVRFYLYPNPVDKEYSEEIRFGDKRSLERSNFFIGFPLKIVIHGFTKSHVHESMQVIKNAYLTRQAHETEEGGKNIILVDWEPIANPKIRGDVISYRYAVGNVAVVGKRVGEFIQFLLENRAINGLKDVHIIGFSLGAHVAGNAGSTLKELNAGQPPARVTGLDPAGPAFYEGLMLSHRHLHKTDGRFVDVYHTNMGTLGTINALGHVDFYPNGGGPVQKRCEEEFKTRNSNNGTAHTNFSPKGFITRFSDLSSCAHNKAPEFFAFSILNPTMIGCQCNNYEDFKTGVCQCSSRAIFGEFCDSRAKGKFYLDI